MVVPELECHRAIPLHSSFKKVRASGGTGGWTPEKTKHPTKTNPAIANDFFYIQTTPRAYEKLKPIHVRMELRNNLHFTGEAFLGIDEEEGGGGGGTIISMHVETKRNSPPNLSYSRRSTNHQTKANPPLDFQPTGERKGATEQAHDEFYSDDRLHSWVLDEGILRSTKTKIKNAHVPESKLCLITLVAVDPDLVIDK